MTTQGCNLPVILTKLLKKLRITAEVNNEMKMLMNQKMRKVHNCIQQRTHYNPNIESFQKKKFNVIHSYSVVIAY